MSETAMERDIMKHKIISVSKKRQITIPLTQTGDGSLFGINKGIVPCLTI